MCTAKYAIVDYRMGSESVNKLSEYAENIVFTKKINTYDAINGHADIQVCKISNNEIVCAPSCYDYYKNNLIGTNVIKGESEPDNKYPNDILYNVFCTDRIAVHNFKYTDKKTLSVIDSKFLKHINVHQGYSCCSICELADGAVITDDDGIYKTLTENEIDVLKLEHGIVNLPGMNYGFIGGAAGLYKDKLFFNGKVINTNIIDFCKEHNTKIIELSNDELIDIGSIIFLK